MRFIALACDYDGTLATHGLVREGTVRALEACLASGRKLLLVTGRELDELQHLFPRLDLFEWIVAENGGLLFHPATNTETPLCATPPEEFVAQLRRRAVQPISVGRTIIATWEPHETTVLRTIHDLGLEMQVIFNKGAVMILPSGVNKATGLLAALKRMGISPHNLVAVGDAENDHALLASGEAGVAVFNAVPQLKEKADFTTIADHGEGVQELIQMLLENDLASLTPKLERHCLCVGHDRQGNQFRIGPYRENVLIAGGTAKERVAAANAIVCPLLARDYQVCVIDLEGTYANLHDTLSIGTAEKPPDFEPIFNMLEPFHESLKIDLQGLPSTDRSRFFQVLLRRLLKMREQLGRPHWIVINDAQLVWPGERLSELNEYQKFFNNIVFLAQDAKSLPSSVLSTTNLVMSVGKSSRSTLQALETSVGKLPPLNGNADLHEGQILAWKVPESSVHQVSLSVKSAS